MLLTMLRLFIIYTDYEIIYYLYRLHYMERYAAALGGLIPKYVDVSEPYMHV